MTTNAEKDACRERVERAEADAKAWQESYDGMWRRWLECDLERLALKEELESLRIRTGVIPPGGDHA